MSSSTTSINDLAPDGMVVGGGAVQQQPMISAGRMEPIRIEKGKSELPNVSYAPLDVHPNPYLNGITEVTQGPVNPLPSHDIPKNTIQYAQDEGVLPNYIPPPSRMRRPPNYVDELSDESVDQFRKKKYRKRLWDDLLEQIQVPLLVALLYFVLHTPYFDGLFHSQFFHYFPGLFSSVGVINSYGLAVKAILFGAAYAGLMRFITLDEWF